MRLITDMFEKYNISYDYANKILNIRKKMPVREFAKLKRILYNFTNLEIKDIQLWTY